MLLRQVICTQQTELTHTLTYVILSTLYWSWLLALYSTFFKFKKFINLSVIIQSIGVDGINIHYLLNLQFWILIQIVIELHENQHGIIEVGRNSV